jgi:hypothetical protein
MGRSHARACVQQVRRMSQQHTVPPMSTAYRQSSRAASVGVHATRLLRSPAMSAELPILLIAQQYCAHVKVPSLGHVHHCDLVIR